MAINCKHFILLLVFLFGQVLLFAQNCGCCHLDDCPCKKDCEVLAPQPALAPGRGTGPGATARNHRTVQYIESDAAGSLIIQKRVLSIQQGGNSIQPFAVGERVAYQFKDKNGNVVSGVFLSAQLRSSTLSLEVARELSRLESRKLLGVIQSSFAALKGLGKPVEIGRTEVPILWFQTFIADSTYRTSAEEKGSSIIRVLGGTADRLKDGISWRHDPAGRPQIKVNHPAVHVSWQDAKAFCRWLSALDPAYDYRLPTLQEWECALGISRDLFYLQHREILTYRLANLADVSLADTLPYKKNRLDDYNDQVALTAACGSTKSFSPIHDLIGNVAEWLEDNPLPHQPQFDKLFIGGSYFSHLDECAAPQFAPANWTAPGLGFRLVREKKLISQGSPRINP